MWIYSQGFGTLYYRARGGGEAAEVGKGYSGFGNGLNDPTFECSPGLGPIPRGSYSIGGPKTGPTEFSLPLTPDVLNDACERSSFMIHGDHKRKEPPRMPNMASHGCIILDRNIREQIWNSGDHELLVVDYGV